VLSASFLLHAALCALYPAQLQTRDSHCVVQRGARSESQIPLVRCAIKTKAVGLIRLKKISRWQVVFYLVLAKSPCRKKKSKKIDKIFDVSFFSIFF
jgi:hypothetical protein